MKAEQALELLCHAFDAGRSAHGYLVVGPPRGTAQAVVDRLLQHLFCTETARPCGECVACRQSLLHTHPDLHWLEPEKKSRQFGADTVRDLTRMANQTSYAGGWRAGVLVNADRLTPSAANAFLKTLEEPPPRCAFFLLTDAPQALLPTILSRCQRVTVEGPPVALPADVEARLVGILSMGRPDRALFALGQSDQLKALLDEVKEAIAEGEAGDGGEAAEADVDDDVLAARVSARFRETRSAILQFMLAWQRDVVMLLCGCDHLVYNTPHVDALRRAAAGLTFRSALRNIGVVEALARRLERNMPEEPVFELGFAQLTAGGDNIAC